MRRLLLLFLLSTLVQTVARALYEKNVEHYRRLLAETTGVVTPDGRVNEAFAWAKVGIGKGFVENPLLGRDYSLDEPGRYVRREVTVPLGPPAAGRTRR